MTRLERVLTGILASLLAICLLAIAVIVVTLVVMRYLFNSSITGANEAITILFVYTTSIGAAIAVGQREHIAISVAVDRLGDRSRRFVDALTLVMIGLLNATMVILSIGWIRITGDYLMPTTGLPRMVAQLCIPIGCGLAVFYCVTRFVSLFQAPAIEEEVYERVGRGRK